MGNCCSGMNQDKGSGILLNDGEAKNNINQIIKDKASNADNCSVLIKLIQMN